eukprot:SAG11_NODE_2490_length_3294_cov_3.906416_1_plen_378_part_00
MWAPEISRARQRARCSLSLLFCARSCCWCGDDLSPLDLVSAMELDAAALASFEENGFLVIANVFGPAELQEWRAEAGRIAELAINSSVFHGQRSGRVDIGLNQSGHVILRRLQPFIEMSLAFSRLAANERILAPLRSIMRDEPVLMPEKCKLNYKQQLSQGGHSDSGSSSEMAAHMQLNEKRDDSFGAFPVHNDYAYYRAQRCPLTALSSCVILDDCTMENGPLHFWPGSHKRHVEHESGPNGLQVRAHCRLPTVRVIRRLEIRTIMALQVPQGKLGSSRSTAVLATAGSFVIFAVTAVHSSQVSNLSLSLSRLSVAHRKIVPVKERKCTHVGCCPFSQPNWTPKPRRLIIFAHCPAAEFEPQLHSSSAATTIGEGE